MVSGAGRLGHVIGMVVFIVVRRLVVVAGDGLLSGRDSQSYEIL